MKVAIDILPLKSAHQFRGIGFYTKQLVESLQLINQPNFKIELLEDNKYSKDADLIHYPYFDLFRMTLPLLKKKKTIVTVHDVIPLIFPKQYPSGFKGEIIFKIQRLSLKNAKAIICDSKASKKDIIKYLGFPGEKIYVIYLAPGKNFRKLTIGKWKLEIKQKYHLPDTFVLYVGDINYHKNVLGLVAACKKIRTPVVIIGKQVAKSDFDQTHIENQPLVQLIKLYGKDPEVIRLGFVADEELVAIYNLASVYCQPSFYEGFGLPVLQAMACGTPVVCADTGSLPEICGQAAMIVNPNKDQDLARGLNRVLSSDSFCDKLIQAGFKQAKKFSWLKTAAETLKVYEKVIQSRTD